MSSHLKGQERPCPLKLAGCTGQIRSRAGQSCANCANVARRGQQVVTAPKPVITPPTADQLITTDRKYARLLNERDEYKERYATLLKHVEQLELEKRVGQQLEEHLDTFYIQPTTGSRTSEATPVVVASDWHSEELVGPEVGGLNIFNTEVFHARSTRFFQSTLRLLRLLNQDVTINTVVLALLGDFITNEIHGAENAESNELAPIHALIRVQNVLVSGIDFLLANTTYNFVLPCHSGNHARTTDRTRIATENGHSLEYLMYVHMKDHYRNEPRLTFLVADGMHSYVQIYDETVRFQHGHGIKYGGGVGGIYIPVNKKLDRYNQARHADVDIMGHFHQLIDGGRFLVNGSLIGYNSFAVWIAAAFEPPKQLLTLFDKKRGRTATWPILLNQ